MRLLVLAPVLLVLAAPAQAAGGGGKNEPVGRYVDMSALAIPIIQEGRLRNYVFVNARVNLTGKADVAKLRAKAPYFRDALVRAAHRTSLADPNDLTRVDETRLAAVLTREAAALSGPGMVASSEVVLQNPQRRAGLTPIRPKPY